MSLPPLKLHRPADEEPDEAARLAAEELIRPPAPVAARIAPTRALEPYSRAWFEELEQKRHSGAGTWLRTALEVTRHHSESLLMLTPGAGSDACQYHRHGTEVTVCLTPTDPPGLLQSALKVRGVPLQVVVAPTPTRLPFAHSRFDLAYMNLLAAPPDDVPGVVSELYRVLKPGGKLFLLAPAHYHVGYFERRLLPWRPWLAPAPRPDPDTAQSGRSLKRLCADFTDATVVKRHLRKSDLPTAWRAIPTCLLGRVMGRVLAYKGLKPLSAAYATVESEAA